MVAKALAYAGQLITRAGRIIAGMHAITRRRCRGRLPNLLSALPLLPLLVGLATPAFAQTGPSVNTNGSYTVPQDWALKPSAINAGGSFRLLFISSAQVPATSTNIETYNNFVQTFASEGHAAIRPYSSAFRVLGSTAAVDARDNTMTTGTGVPIYWLNGPRVADNYGDFYDGTWDTGTREDRDESGVSFEIPPVDPDFFSGDCQGFFLVEENPSCFPYTGSNNNGTGDDGEELGSSNVRTGRRGSGLGSGGVLSATLERSLFALSPVFVVAQTTSTVTIAPDTASVTEGTDASFTITVTPSPSAPLAIDLFVVDAPGSDFVMSGSEGTQTVTVPITGSFTHPVSTVGDSMDEPDGPVTVTVAGRTDIFVATGSATVNVLDDEPTTVTLSGESGDINEGGSKTITITLGRNLVDGERLPVPLTLGGAATRGTDYTLTGMSATGVTYRSLNSGTAMVTFTGAGTGAEPASDPMSATLILRAANDSATDDAESVQIGLGTLDGDSGTGLGGGATGTGSLNFNINESPPGLFFTPTSPTVDEGSSVTYTVGLASAPMATVTLAISGHGTDLTPDETSLMFTVGDWTTAQTVTVTAAQDADAADDTVTLTHTASGGGYNGVTGTVEVTVSDDDMAGVTVSQTDDDTTVSEAGGTDLYTVVLNTQPVGDVEMTVTSSSESAVTVSVPGLTFTPANWATAQTVTVMGVNDDIANFRQVGVDVITNRLATITHRITSGDGNDDSYPISVRDFGFVDVIITDDEMGRAGVTFTEMEGGTTVGEAGGTATYTVVLNTQPPPNTGMEGFTRLTNDVVIRPTSGAPTDATVSPSALTFTNANWDTQQTITVTGVNNAVDAANQEVTITHDSASANVIYNELDPDPVTATVIDDEPTTVTLAGPAGDIMEGGTKAITVTLGRTLAAGEALPVPLTFGGAATPGTDYTVTGAAASGVAYTGLDSATGTVTFTGPSATTATLTLTATAGDGAEAIETVNIDLGTLSASSGTGLGGGATGTDNLDSFNIISLGVTVSGAGGVTVEESAMATYTVVLNTRPAGNVEITVASDATSAVTVSAASASLIFTMTNWDTAQTVTVTGVNDNVNGDRTATISHTIASGNGDSASYPDDLEIASVVVTVIDDDLPEVSFAVASFATNEGSGTYNVVVDLSPAPITNTTINYTVSSAGTAISGTDYTALSGMVMASATASSVNISVAVTDDSVDETNETIILTLAAGSGYTVGTISDHTLTIIDNDTRGLTFNPAMLTVEEGESGTYTAALASAPIGEVTVTISGHGGSTNLTLDTDSLIFTSDNWATAQTVTVTSAQDNNTDDDTVTLTHDASGADYGAITADLDVMITDEGEPVVSFATATGAANEDAGTYNVVVNLNPVPAVDTTITYTVAGTSTATIDDDYNRLSGMVVASANAPSVNIQVAITDDSVNEVNETIILFLSTGSGYTVGTDRVHTLTITDDDLPVASFAAGTSDADEDAGTHNVVVNLNPVPAVDTTITYTVAGTSTATIGDDYNRLSGMVLVSANAPSANIQVAITDDSADEVSETIILFLSAGSGYTVGTDRVHTLTITDNDTAGVTITETNGTTTVAETGDSVDTYGVVLNTQPTNSVEITATSDTTNAATVSPTTLTFAMTNWNMAQTFTVTGVDNNLDDAMNQRTATISHAAESTDTNYDSSLDIGDVEVTVTDDDVPVLTISAAGDVTSVAEGSPITIIVTSDIPVGNPIDIGDPGTPDGGSAIIPATVFTVGETTLNHQVTFDENDDDDPPGRTIVRSIEAGSGYTLGDPSSLTLAVTDDDPTTVTLAGAEGDIAEGDSKEITITLGRGLVNGEMLPVPLTFMGEATPGTDYTVTGTTAAGVGYEGPDSDGNGTVTFTGPASGTTATVATLTLSATRDSLAETGGETVDIDLGTLSTSSGTNLEGGASGTDNLADFDIISPGVTVSETEITIREGEEGAYTVVLDTQPAGSVEITVTSGTTSAATVSASLEFTASNWNTVQTVTVAGVNDNIGGDRMATISHSIGSGDGDGEGYPDDGSLVIATVDVTVTDDDTRGLVFNSAAVTVDEGDSGTYTMTLANMPTGDVTVAISSHSGSDLTPNPTSLMFTMGNWSTAQTVTVTASQDGDTDNDMVTLTHTASGGGYDTITGAVIVTITDDDLPIASFATLTSMTSEGSGTHNVRINLNPVPLSNITISYTVTDTSATSGDDYNALSGTILALANASVIDIPVTIINDSAQEGSELLRLTLTAGSDYGLRTGTTHDLTIRDDDLPVVSFAAGSSMPNEGSGTHNIEVNLNPVPASDTTITYTVTDLIATVDDDYMAPSGSVFVTADTPSVNIPVTIIDDSGLESNELFRLTLIDGSGYTLGTQSTHDVVIVDNDLPLASFVVNTSMTNEGSGTHNIMVNLSLVQTTDTTITYTVAEGVSIVEATPDTDYTALTGMVVVPAGMTRADISVVITEDNTDERDETISLTLAGLSGVYGTASPSIHQLTLIDDDATTVTLAGAADDIAEGDTKEITVTLSRRLFGGEVLPVPLTFAGTASLGTDYTLTGTAAGGVMYTIPDSGSAGTVTFTGLSGIAPAIPTATLTLTAINGGTTVDIGLGTLDDTSGTGLGGGASGTDNLGAFNIISPGVTISERAITITEGDEGGYPVVLATQPGAAVTITPASSASATATVSPALTFTSANWDTAQTITVAGEDNEADAANQAVTITHAATSTDTDYNLTPAPVTATVIDDDPTVVTLARSIDSTGAVGEGGTVGFTITLSRRLTGSEIIDVPLSISGTNVTTDDWSLALNSSFSNTGVTLSSQATATPRVRFTGSRIASRIVRMQLTAATDGIAEGGGEGSETYTIALGPNDATANGFDLATLGTNVGGGADPDSSANTFNVQVNDPPPAGVTISETAITIDEGGEGTYTVVLDTQPAGTVEITVESDTTSAATVGTSSASLTFTMSNWDMAQTVTVMGVEDNAENERTATISHSIASGDGDSADYPDGLPIADVDVTVSNNDLPMVNFAAATSMANEGSGTHSIMVNLSSAQSSDTTINYTVANTSTATADADYTELSGTVVVSASETSANIPVVITNDRVDEANETVVLTLAAGSDYRVGTTASAHTLTITDNDTAGVTVSETGGGTTVAEAGGTDNYGIMLSTQPSGSVTITAESDTTSAATVTPATLTFTTANWNAAQTFTVTGIDNNRDDAMNRRIATISHAAASTTDTNYVSGLDIDDVEVTVTDEDVPELTVSVQGGHTTIVEGGQRTIVVTSNIPIDGSVGFGAPITPNNGNIISISSVLTTGETPTRTFGVGFDRSNENDVDDPPGGRTATTGINAGTGYTLGDPSTVTFTVIDDDPTTVTLAGAAGDILAGDDKQITVTLGRGLVNGEILPVPLTFGGSATPGTDYTVTGAAAAGITYSGLDSASAMVTFTGPASGTTATTATLTLSAAANADGTVDIDLGTLDTDSGTGLDGGADGTDNLADFDIFTPGVTVSETQGGTTVAEASGTDNYGIRLDSPPTGSVTITATSNTTSAATVTPETLTFTTANWNAAQTFTVTGMDNNRDDAMNRRMATISHAASSTTDTDYVSGLAIDDVEVTVTDDDVPVVTVSVRDGHTTLVERGAQRTIVVTSDIPIDGSDQVVFSVINPNNGGVVFRSDTLIGETPMNTFTVFLNNNDIDDPPGRTGTTGIRAGTGYTRGDPSTVTFRVIDDDPTTVTLEGTAGNINEGASADITVTLGRELVMGEVLPVPLTLGGTATRGTDYTLTGTPANNIAYNIPDTGNVGTVTFTGPAPTTATLTLAVEIDTTSDASETIDIGLGTLDDTSGTGLEGGAAGTDSLTEFTIMEQPTIALPSTLTVEEGASASYPVVLATAPTVSTTIAVTGHTGTDLTLDTASLVFTTGNWDTAQMVTVTAGEDADDATDMVTLTHTATGGNYDALTAVIRVSITDPDMAGVTITETAITIDEGDEGMYTVVLDTQPAGSVEITVASDTTSAATVGTSSASLTFTMSNWNTAQTVTVTGVNDNVVGDRTATISHTIASGAGDNASYPDGLDINTVDVIVTNDDVPVASFAVSTSSAGEDAGTHNVVVNLSPAPAAATTITYTVAGTSTATIGDDYNRLSGMVVVSESGTSANIPVTIIDDSADEAGETVILFLSAGSGYTVGTDDVHTLTITDNDTAGVTISETSITIDEGDEGTYTVVLDTQPASSVEITVASDTTSAVTVDTRSASLTFTMSNWNTAQTVTVTGVNDNVVGDRTATISHTIASGDGDNASYPDGLDINTVDVIVTNDDVPVASFAVSTSSAGEDAGTHNVVVNLSPAPAAATTITYTVAGTSTATIGDDYNRLSGMVVVSESGTSANIPVTIIDDSADEAGETVILFLSAGSGYTVGTDDVHTLTITDDDTAGVTISETSITIDEGDEGTYTVVLDTQPASSVEITVASDTTSAVTVGTSSASLTFTMSNWNAAQTVTVTGVNDNVVVGRTATISHTIASSAGDNASYPDGLDINTVDVTVTDDDTAGVTVTETEGDTTVVEAGGTDIYEVVLDTQPTADVSVTPAPGAGATVNPMALTFTSANWNMVQTITVTGVNNAIDAADQEVTITHTASSSDLIYNVIVPAPVTATVTDDDATEVTLAGPAGDIEEAGTKIITITLSRGLFDGEVLPVPLTFAGAATLGTDYTLASTAATGVMYTIPNSGSTGTVTFTGPSATVATLTLTATPDSEVEGAEAIIIGLGPLGDSSGTGLSGGASGTDNLDDFNIQGLPTIDITGGTAVTEGSSVTFTVTASRAPSADLSINLSIADAAAGDFLASGDEGNRMVALAGGNTEVTVEIATQADTTDEASGMVTVTVATGTGYIPGTPPLATVRVNDDDVTTVTLAGTAGNINEGVTRNITVTLDRALAAGESLAVPLTLGGTATRGTDYTLTGIAASGIAYTIPDSGLVGTVTFTGPASAVATLALVVQTDTVSDANETISIALGTLNSSSGSGLGGGATGTGSLADFTIMEDPTIALPLTLAVDEGDSANYPVVLANAPTGGNVTVTVTGHSGTDLTLNTASLEFTAANWNTVQTVTVMAAADDDAVNDTATLTHTASGGSNYDGLTAELTVNTADADTAELSFVDVPVTVAEGGTAEYSVELSAEPTAAVTVAVSGQGGSTDLTLNTASLTFTVGNWDTAQVLTVTAAEDDDGIDDRVTLMHMASGATEYGAVTDDVVVTINDDDMVGVTITETEGTTTVAEAGGTDNYGMMLDTQPSDSVMITATSDATSAATVTPTTLTFTTANWNTVQTFTVTGIDNNRDDAMNRRIATISHEAASTDTNYDDSNLDIDDVEATVTDEDVPELTVSVQGGHTTIDEGGDPRTIVVASDISIDGDVFVGSGIVFDNGGLTQDSNDRIMGENPTLMFTVSYDDNDIDDPPGRTATTGINAGTGFTLGDPSTVTFRVIDDDPTTVTLAGAAGDIANGDDKQITITLGRGLVNGEILPVPLTFGGSATPGTDYTVTGAAATGITYTGLDGAVGTVTFTGPTSGTTATTATLTLSAVNAGVTVDIDLGTLDTDSGTGLGGGAAGTDNLADFDIVSSGVTVSETAITIAEGDEGTYTVVLSTQPAGNVEITVASDTTSAVTVGTSSASLTFTMSNWDTAQTVTVTGVNDNLVSERTADISHRIASGDGDGASYPDGLVIAAVEVTVTDNDTPPGLTFEGAPVTVAEGGTAEYAVELATQPTGPVTVTISGHSGTDLTLNTASLEFTTDNWDTAQTVTVTAAADDTDTADDTVTLTHTASGADYGAVTGNVVVTITDDDLPVASFAAGTSSAAEGAGTHNVVVSLSSVRTAATTITYTVAGTSTATIGDDYTRLSGTVVVPADRLSANIPVTITDDSLQEASETVVLFLGTGSGYTVGTDRVHTLTITDDDLPVASFAAGTSSAGEDAGTHNVVVNLSPAPTAATTITYTVAGTSTATMDTDYTMLSGMVVVPASLSSVNIPVTIDDDDVDEANETVILFLSAGSGYTVGTDDVHTLTITDNDTRGLTFNPETLTVDEGGSEGYTVILTSEPTMEVTVAINDPDGLTRLPASLTFTSTNWATVQTVTVTAEQDDDTINDMASLTHTVSGTTGYSTVTGTVAVTVNDDDDADLEFTDAPVTVNEGGNAEYAVELATEPTGEVTVTISVASDTDLMLNPNRLTFTSVNWDTAQTVMVTANPDADAADDTVTLLHTASGATEYGLVTGNVEVTISDDDDAGLMFVNTPVTVDEGASAEYTVELATEPTGDVTVDVSGHSGSDLMPAPTSLTFTAVNWETAQAVTVTAGQDSDTDNDMVTLTHRASGATEYAGIDGDVAVTITDDDVASVVVSPTDVTVGEAGGTATYTVVLDTPPISDVVIMVASDMEDVATVSVTGVTFTTTNWNRAQTVTVTGVNDGIDNAIDRTASISHRITTGAGGDYPTNLAIDPVRVTAEDDDIAGVSVSEEAVTVAEAGGRATYTVVLDTEPTAEVTLTAISQGTFTATVNPPSEITFTQSNWGTAQTLTVMGVNDDIDNPGGVRAVSINHGIRGGYPNSVEVASVRVAVMDDEPDAGLEFSRDGLSIDEGGAGLGYEVALTTEPTGDVTVTLTGAPAAVTLSANSLMFTAGNWSMVQTVTVTAEEDTNTTDESAMLVHTASGGGYDGVTGEVAVEVTDDDRDAGVSIGQAELTVTEGEMEDYRVVLDAPPDSDVEITVSSSGAAASVNPPILTFTASNWSTEQTVTVTGADDDIDNAADRTANLSHAITTGDGGGYTTALEIEDVTVTVADDDEAGLMFTSERLSVIEGGAGQGYRMALTSEPTGEVTVTITGNPVDVRDVTLSTASLMFTAGNWNMVQTVTVTAGEDANTADESATLTHTASGGGYDEVTGEIAVEVTDDDRDAGVSIGQAELTVTEGEMEDYRVILDAQPDSDVEITVSSSGAAASVNPPILTFTASNWSMEQTVTVTGADDDIDNAADRTANLSHAITTVAGGGYTTALEIEDVTVTVADDDEAGLMFTSERLSVIEGETGRGYRMALTSEPTGEVTVTITGNPGDVTLSTASLMFTAGNWDTAQTVTVTAGEDSDMTDEDVALTHTASGGGYDGVSGTLTVEVSDDDRGAGVTVSESSLTIGETGTGTYTIRLNSQPEVAVLITVTPETPRVVEVNKAGGMAGSSQFLTFTPMDWGIAQEVTVTGVDDDIDNPGRRRVSIRHAIAPDGGDGAGYPNDGTLEIGAVLVTVTDDEGRALSAGTPEMQLAQEVWLPRFGLTAIEHMLGGLDYRFSVADRPPPGLSGNLNGLPAGRGLNGVGTGGVRGLAGVDGFGNGNTGGGDGLGAGSVDRLFNLSQTLSLRDMLRGSRFVHRDKAGISVWGQASYSRYEDARAGVSMDGEVTTGILGVDRDNGRTLLGLALSYSDGDGDWSGEQEKGELSSTLTSLLPYIRYDVTERLQVWGALSYGRGELEQTSASVNSKHDLEQVSASMGLRGTLLERPVEEGGLKLALTSEATLARIESDDDGGVRGAETGTRRFRLGLEWSWQLPQSDGGRLIPELELGMRYDGGDTSDGLGVELGGGISWELPSTGLTLDVRGRRLLDHENAERHEWGVSGSLRYDLRPGSAYGPSLSLSQEYGNASASGGLDRLLSGSLSDALEEDSSQPGSPSRRWSLEGEWGLSLDSGATGVPYAGLSSSGANRDLTLGWRLLSVPGGELNTELDVKAIRREDGQGEANHGVGAELKLSW